MDALKHRCVLCLMTGVLCVASAISFAQADEQASPVDGPPPNDTLTWPLTNTFIPWWRPLRIQPRQSVRQQVDHLIQRVEKGAMTVDAAATHARSMAAPELPFLLAAHQSPKAASILMAMLNDYKDRQVLDDAWLRIIAALGRIPSPKAGKRLRAELKRTHAKYERPLLDAAAANLVETGRASPASVQKLSNLVPGNDWETWLFSLQWLQLIKGEQRTKQFVLNSLESFPQEEMVTAIQGHSVTSRRLEAISLFITSTRKNWNITLEITTQGSKNSLVREYLACLATQVLRCKAYVSEERPLKISNDLVEALVGVKPKNSRRLTINAAVLDALTVSDDPRWQEWLHARKQGLDPKDKEVVEFMIHRFDDPKWSKVARIDFKLKQRPLPHDNRPVYMRGFGRTVSLNPRTKSKTHHE